MTNQQNEDDPIVWWTTPSGNARISMRQSEAVRRDKAARRGKVIARVVGVVVVVAIVALGLTVSWLVTGGNVRCMFAADPALCATVDGVVR